MISLSSCGHRAYSKSFFLLALIIHINLRFKLIKVKKFGYDPAPRLPAEGYLKTASATCPNCSLLTSPGKNTTV
jgi:hypothetical protein